MAFNPFSAALKLFKGDNKKAGVDRRNSTLTLSSDDIPSLAERGGTDFLLDDFIPDDFSDDDLAEETPDKFEILVAETQDGHRWLKIQGREYISAIAVDMKSRYRAEGLAYSPFSNDAAYVLRDAADRPLMIAEVLEEARYITVLVAPDDLVLQRRAMISFINSDEVGPYCAGDTGNPEDESISACKRMGILIATVNGDTRAWDRDTFLDDLSPGSTVGGRLDLSECMATRVPSDIVFQDDVDLSSSPNLTYVGSIRCNGNFNLSSCETLKELTAGTVVVKDLDVEGCPSLVSYPGGIKVGGTTNLRDCVNLRHLPEVMVSKGDISFYGCTGLERLPSRLVCRELSLCECTAITDVPLLMANSMDLDGCTKLASVHPECLISNGVIRPDGGRVSSVEDVRAWLAASSPTSRSSTQP